MLTSMSVGEGYGDISVILERDAAEILSPCIGILLVPKARNFPKNLETSQGNTLDFRENFT